MARKSKVEAAETRKRIVATARALFADNGYIVTTTAQIARATGVTEGALFNHFPDKKSLFREILVDLQTGYDRSVRQAAIGDGGGTAMDALMRAFSASIALAREPAFARIVLREGRSVLGEADWHAIDAGMGARSTEFGLRAVAAEMGVSEGDFPVLSRLVLGMLNETIFVDLERDSAISTNACIATIRELIVLWVAARYKK